MSQELNKKYAENSNRAKILIRKLQDKIESYDKDFNDKKINWGHVGDLGRIINELEYLTGEKE